MIVDLDAHQGNGYARDVLKMPKVERFVCVCDVIYKNLILFLIFFSDRIYILDMYNASIYPRDEYAKGGISRSVELRSRTKDHDYLKLLELYVVWSRIS